MNCVPVKYFWPTATSNPVPCEWVIVNPPTSASVLCDYLVVSLYDE